MVNDLVPVITFFRWRKFSWYALAPLASTMRAAGLPFLVVKKNIAEVISSHLSRGYRVIYAESTRTFDLDLIIDDIHSLKNSFDNNLLIVAGGPHASGDPGHLLAKGIDICVIGEGEATFPQLVSLYKHNNFSIDHLLSVPGLAFLDNNGRLVTTNRPPRLNLDDYLPYFSDDVFPLYPPIELVRGCRFGCRFCQVPRLHGSPRFRSLTTIEKIVKAYIHRFHSQDTIDLRFIAPNSLSYYEKGRGQPNIEALSSLLRMLRKYPVRVFLGTFPSEIRPEYITEETLSLLSSIDNHRISIGFQTASDRLLKYMNRGHDVAACLKAYDLLTDQGFEPVFDFLLGCPTETADEQWATLDMIKELSSKSKSRLHYFMPLPGTPWATIHPTLLAPGIETEIGRLSTKGVVLGDFGKQIRLSRNSWRD